MNKWSQIKKAILFKCSMTETEARDNDYLEKMIYLANECLDFVANTVKPKIAEYEVTTTEEDTIITLPDDFITLGSYGIFLNGVRTYTDYIQLTRRKLKLKEIGTYTIYYEARWEEILDDDSELDIDVSVLSLLPNYIASQILLQDDPTTSVMYKNYFEEMFARLSDIDNYEEEEIIPEWEV